MKAGVWSKSRLAGKALSRIFGMSERIVWRTPSTAVLNSVGRFLGKAMPRFFEVAAFFLKLAIVL